MPPGPLLFNKLDLTCVVHES